MNPLPSTSDVLPSASRRALLERLGQSQELIDQAEVRTSMWTDGVEREILWGHIRLEGYVARVRVELPPVFPLCLPQVFIETLTPPVKYRPHILVNGRLCLEAESDLFLDARDPWGILSETLWRARRLLQEILTGDRAAAFAQELVSYWKGGLFAPAVPCFVAAGERPHLTKALYQDESLLAVADNSLDPIRFSPERAPVLPSVQRNAVYIPIDPLAVDRDFHPTKLARLDTLRGYVRALPERDRRALNKLLGRCGKHSSVVILGVRRPEGERALIGIQFHDTRGRHPLAPDGDDGRIEQLKLQRRDAAFLAPRGGANLDLRGRKVMLAGCGAVGGHLALALARAGVGELTLVDPDRFAWENTYRHVCGRAWVAQPKVTGLANELERLLPYITVHPYERHIETLLREKPRLLDSQDLVITALGNPTFELDLNQRLWNTPRSPPGLFCWLEPLGLGGHALLTRGRGTDTPRGCLECLYDAPVRGAALRNLAAFATPGVTYTRDTLGCGSQYMPFGDLDAQHLAWLTARLALRVLRGEERGAPLVSWKGDASAFLQAGFEVTPWYEAQTRDVQETHAYVRSDCRICRT